MHSCLALPVYIACTAVTPCWQLFSYSRREHAQWWCLLYLWCYQKINLKSWRKFESLSISWLGLNTRLNPYWPNWVVIANFKHSWFQNLYLRVQYSPVTTYIFSWVNFVWTLIKIIIINKNDRIMTLIIMILIQWY